MIRPAIVAMVLLTALVSVVYPVAVWGFAQVLFPFAANGSLLEQDGKVTGSALIGQDYAARPAAFHGRPSSAGKGYDAANSGGSNLGPLSQKLLDAVKTRAEAYRAENGLPAEASVPVDAVTASGSGLDPHISVANAALQVPRVARERGMSEDAVRKLVDAHTEGRDLGVFGERRVNVVTLNAALP